MKRPEPLGPISSDLEAALEAAAHAAVTARRWAAVTELGKLIDAHEKRRAAIPRVISLADARKRRDDGAGGK